MELLHSPNSEGKMKRESLIPMPDFSSSGIWYFNPPERGDSMVDYEELKISKELANEFEQWISYYVLVSGKAHGASLRASLAVG